MPPPDTNDLLTADGDEGMAAAIRAAAGLRDADEGEEQAFANEGYDSEEENRRGVGLATRSNRKRKGGDDGGGFGESEEPGNKTVGKNKVEKIVDQTALTVEKAFLDFVQNDEVCAEGVLRMKEYGKTTLWLPFSRLTDFDADLAKIVREHYFRFKPNMEKALQQLVSIRYPEYAYLNDRGDPNKLKDFQVSFYGLPETSRIRDLQTNCLGELVSMTGTITRTSETRPELLIGAFRCLKCSTISDGVEQEFKYTEPKRCKECAANDGWQIEPGQSRFVDWQKVRVQENATEVPAGSMPRTIEIITRHECVEIAKPGDKCVFTGSLIVVPDVSKLKAPGDPPGLKTARNEGGRGKLGAEDEGVMGLTELGVRDLNYRLAFLACSVQPCDGSGLTSDLLDETGETTREETIRRVRETFSELELREIRSMARQPNLIEKMKRSVAPAIYGHGDVKLGVLLLLFGGVHKKTPEGIHLRGDINVCIVGDPSTAKSQFLRYVCGFAPRAVYTSGKASTAAGLTASVIRDPETGEFCIEAGALMLADNGVCCIDEFDKMDDIDQVAIHEAMEQQTISITKAGIQATLNARTSVLAAANPIHGRYDRSKTLKANLTVGPAIMSRFDLFFVVLDECDEVNDRAIADHILEVHRKRLRADEIGEVEKILPSARAFSTEQMRRYLKYARTIDPIMTPEVQPLLVDCYVRLRQGDAGVGQSKQAYRITVRQLEALVRLSEAIARMHLDEYIRPSYVEKAYQLLRTSIVQVESESIVVSSGDGVQGDEDDILAGDMAGIDRDHIRLIDDGVIQSIAEREGELGDDFRGIEQSVVVDEVVQDDIGFVWDQLDASQKRHLINQRISRLLQRNTIRAMTLPAGFHFPAGTPSGESLLLGLGIQQPSGPQQSGTFIITQSELQRIGEAVKEYIREVEEAQEGDDDFFGVAQSDVVDHILQNHMPELNEESDAVQARDQVNQVIRILIHPQNIVTEAEPPRGVDFEEDVPAEERRLLLLNRQQV